MTNYLEISNAGVKEINGYYLVDKKISIYKYIIQNKKYNILIKRILRNRKFYWIIYKNLGNNKIKFYWVLSSNKSPPKNGWKAFYNCYKPCPKINIIDSVYANSFIKSFLLKDFNFKNEKNLLKYYYKI